MRKVRRDIIRTINDFRERNDLPSVYMDALTNRAAMEYANILLEDKKEGDIHPDLIQQCCDHENIVGANVAIVGMAYLDEDNEAD